MPQILLRVKEEELNQIQEKATEFGLSNAAFVRQIVREYFRKTKQKEEPVNHQKYIRALIPVFAQALGRAQNLVLKGAPEEEIKILKVSQEQIKGMSELLLTIYDQGVQ